MESYQLFMVFFPFAIVILISSSVFADLCTPTLES